MALTTRRIGVFGGTFDPPHLGHLILADEACHQLCLDRLLWVLTPDPPHKQDQFITGSAARLRLVQLAIRANPAFQISPIELDRPGPHYAVDTLNLLHNTHPGDSLVYLIGGDSLHDLPTWHRPADFLAACDGLGVMRRPGDEVDLEELEAVLPGLTRKITWIQAPLLEISSSQIRQNIAAGHPYRYYLPTAVYRAILSSRLYQPESKVPLP